MTKQAKSDEISKRISETEKELKHLRGITSREESTTPARWADPFTYNDPFLDAISDGITVIDTSGRLLHVNEAAERLYGYPATDLRGTALTDHVISVENNVQYLEQFLQAFDHRLPENREYLVVLHSGEQRMLRMSFILREDPLSSERHLWIIHRDLSHQKQLEADLENSRERLDSMLESFPDIVLNIDLTGSILFINPGSSYRGIDKIIGSSIYDYVLPDDHDYIRSEIMRVFEDGRERICESSGIGMDGIVRWYSTRLIPIKHDNQVIALSVCARDNSSKKLTEEELKQSRKTLESILNAVPGALIVLDKKYNTVISNWKGLSLHPKSSRSGVKCYQLYWHREAPCAKCHAKKVFETGKPHRAEWQDGENNGFREVRSYPIINDAGVVKYVVEYIQDITHLKKSEESLARAEMKTEAAHQMKTDFLAKISHELKTPMIGILGFAKLGRERYKKVTKEKLKSYFDTILESGEKLQSLLNNLLDLSQLEGDNAAYDFQRENLSMITTMVLNESFTLLNDHHIEARFNKPAFDDQVLVDVNHIGKVIKNLLTNAILFSKPGDQIEIEISDLNDAVQFEVADSGEGIPENELQLIFEKFSQSSRTKCKSGGKGLGLAIAKKIISDHNGDIWAENAPNQGAVFRFTLPKG